MHPSSSAAVRHAPVLPLQGNPGLAQSQPPDPQVSPDVPPATPARPGVPFAGHDVRPGPGDLSVVSRKRKREEDTGAGSAAGEGATQVSEPASGEGLAGAGAGGARRMATLMLMPMPGSMPGSMRMLLPQVPSMARLGSAASATDQRVADEEFRSVVGPGFTGTLEQKARKVCELARAVLSHFTPAEAGVAGARLGRELQDEWASPGRGELLRAITRGYIQWHDAQSWLLSSQLLAVRGEQVLAAFLHGLAQSPARQGPDPQVSLICEFLECSQSRPASPVRERKARDGLAGLAGAQGKGENKAGTADGKAAATPRLTRKERAQACEQEEAFATFHNDGLAKRLAAVACRVEGGSRITEQALGDILRRVLRVPDDASIDGRDDVRHDLDAKDIGDLMTAIVGAIDDGRGSKRLHMPALIRSILSLDREDGLTSDEVGLAIACVADACTRGARDAQDALNLVLDLSGPSLRTRGAAALAVGAVFGLVAQSDRMACDAEPADLTYMLQIGLDAALQQVGRLAEGSPPARQDRLLLGLLAYRQEVDSRLRSRASRDRSDAQAEKGPFDPAGTALNRFDAGLADLMARNLERARLASQWEWLVRYGRCVGYEQASGETRQALGQRLLPASLRSPAPQAGESAMRSQARLQRRADLLDRTDRALGLAASPLDVVDENGLDNADRIKLIGLCGYFKTATREALAAKVAAVQGSRASPQLRDALLEELLDHTRVPQVTGVEALLALVPTASSSSTSSSSSSSLS